MKRFQNMRALLSMVSMVVLMFFASCATTDRSVVPLTDTSIPGNLTLNSSYWDVDEFGEQITGREGVINGSGTADIYFIPPADLDLMCVVAEYQRTDGGDIVTVKASPYAESLRVEGFGEAKPYYVKLYCVDHSGNESDAMMVTVNPNDPPHLVIFESLTIAGGYGGVELTWINPEQANVMVDVYQEDELGDWILLDTFYSSGEDGYGAIRGMEEVAASIGATIRDHYGNQSDWIYNTVTPLEEEVVEKSVGLYSAPSMLPGDASPWSSGYGVTDIFDNTYIDTGNSCYHSGSNAVSITQPWTSQAITFSLGVDIRLSRFTFWPRGGSHRYFTHNMIEYFNLYGCLELTDEMYETDNIEWNENTGLMIPNFDDWSELRMGWDHTAYEAAGSSDPRAGLISFYSGGGHCYAPSGIVAGETATADDLDWVGNNGHEFNVEGSPVTVRYIRLQALTSWGQTDIFQLAEVDFYGQIQAY